MAYRKEQARRGLNNQRELVQKKVRVVILTAPTLPGSARPSSLDVCVWWCDKVRTHYRVMKYHAQCCQRIYLLHCAPLPHNIDVD